MSNIALIGFTIFLIQGCSQGQWHSVCEYKAPECQEYFNAEQVVTAKQEISYA